MRQKKSMYVHFEVIVPLGDQSVRREVNYMMQGSSTLSSRYRYIADIGSISEHLPACEEHHLKNKCEAKYLLQKIKYECCVCWNMMNSSPLMQFMTPKDYPQDVNPTNGKLEA